MNSTVPMYHTEHSLWHNITVFVASCFTAFNVCHYACGKKPSSTQGFRHRRANTTAFD